MTTYNQSTTPTHPASSHSQAEAKTARAGLRQIWEVVVPVAPEDQGLLVEPEQLLEALREGMRLTGYQVRVVDIPQLLWEAEWLDLVGLSARSLHTDKTSKDR